MFQWPSCILCFFFNPQKSTLEKEQLSSYDEDGRRSHPTRFIIDMPIIVASACKTFSNSFYLVIKKVEHFSLSECRVLELKVIDCEQADANLSGLVFLRLFIFLTLKQIRSNNNYCCRKMWKCYNRTIHLESNVSHDFAQPQCCVFVCKRPGSLCTCTVS